MTYERYRSDTRYHMVMERISVPFNPTEMLQKHPRPNNVDYAKGGIRYGVAITPDGRRAVSASNDNTLRIWDLESGKELALLTADGTTTSCAVSLDGRTIVAGDGTGRVHFLRLVEADETKPPIRDTKIQLLHRKEQAS